MPKNNNIKGEHVTSPLLSLVFELRGFRNNEKDFLMGRMLTLIDSLITDERQNKAAKDIARTIFYERNYHWDEMELMLDQFRNKFCPSVEDGYKYKIDTEMKYHPTSGRNYFPN